jgi:urease accessory protein
MRAGISQLAISGFTVRIMAHLTQDIERVISACHHVISEEWYNRTPGFLRKY